MSILRRAMIDQRNSIVGREKRSAAICERFLTEFKNVERVFLYVSFGSEVDTHGLIETLLKKGKRVFAPRMFGMDMRFYEITDMALLTKSENGILEPPQEVIDTHAKLRDTDVMILPGVIFDEVGGRIGYGMGCYDRYLAKYPTNTVAFAFEAQVQDQPLTLKETDKRYDVLISEKRMIDLRGTHES